MIKKIAKIFLVGIVILFASDYYITHYHIPNLKGSFPIYSGDGFGNGVQIEAGFLTAEHVLVEQSWEVNEIIGEGHIHKGEPMTNRDFALLDLQISDPAPIYCGKLRAGQPIWYKGSVRFGSQLFDIVLKGTIMHTESTDKLDYANSIVMQLPVAFGMSGGPVYDRWGRVIGIISAMAPFPSSRSPTMVIALASPLPEEICTRTNEK